VSTPVGPDDRIRITPREMQYTCLATSSSSAVEIVTFVVSVASASAPSPVSVIPLPATDVLHASNVGSGLRFIRQFAAGGELVIDEPCTGTRHTIDVQHLAAGRYIVLVQDYLGRTYAHQAVIQR
jgi:hypothetical protein